MKKYKILFQNTSPDKSSICFSWDDNFARHLEIIAPEFVDRGLRCTFYINPGAIDFESKHLRICQKLLELGFEIGSHGYQHLHFKQITLQQSKSQVMDSINAIKDKLGVYPATFAFAYHEYTEKHLRFVRQNHLETRNTLANSKRLDITTKITLEQLRCAVDGAINNRRSLIFAGHSVALNLAEIEDKNIITGHEPILMDNLKGLLDYIRMLEDRAEVLTFEQAALKEFVISKGRLKGDSYVLSAAQMRRLSCVGIDKEKIDRLI